MASNSVTNVTGWSCTTCGATDLILNSHDEFVCTHCGQVVAERNIDKGPEWRPFLSDDENRIRVGVPTTPLLRDRGMSTFIGFHNRDSSKSRTEETVTRDMRRLRSWQHRLRSESSQQRNLAKALRSLSRMGRRLELPISLLERASHLYRKALGRGLVAGRSIDGIVAASLFIALRSENLPFTLKDVSVASGRERAEIGKWYRLLVQNLRLEIPVVDAVPHVHRLSAQLGLDAKVAVMASQVVRRAQEKRLTAGRSLVGTAAAAIHYACRLLGVDVSADVIADVARTTDVTLRNLATDFEDQVKI